MGSVVNLSAELKELRRRSIARAFEVEHTTAIYSGLLRKADLISLQPKCSPSVSVRPPR